MKKKKKKEFTIREKLKREKIKASSDEPETKKELCIGISVNNDTKEHAHIMVGSILKGIDGADWKNVQLIVSKEATTVNKEIDYNMFAKVTDNFENDKNRYFSLLKQCQDTNSEYTLILSGRMKASTYFYSNLKKNLEWMNKFPRKSENFGFIKLFYPTVNFGWRSNDMYLLFIIDSCIAITFVLIYSHKIDSRIKNSNWILIFVYFFAFFVIHSIIVSIGKQNSLSIFSRFGLHLVYPPKQQEEFQLGGVACAHLYRNQDLSFLLNFIEKNNFNQENIDQIIDNWVFKNNLKIYHLSPHLFQLILTSDDMHLPSQYFTLTKSDLFLKDSMSTTYMTSLFLDEYL